MALDFPLERLDDLGRPIRLQIISHTLEGYSDYIAMVDLRPEVLVAHAQPKVVQQLHVLRPKPRRMRTQIQEHRLAAGPHDLERERWSRRRQVLPVSPNRLALLRSGDF